VFGIPRASPSQAPKINDECPLCTPPPPLYGEGFPQMLVVHQQLMRLEHGTEHKHVCTGYRQLVLHAHVSRQDTLFLLQQLHKSASRSRMRSASLAAPNECAVNKQNSGIRLRFSGSFGPKLLLQARLRVLIKLISHQSLDFSEGFSEGFRTPLIRRTR